MFQLHKNKINPNYLFNEIVRLKKIVNEPHQHLIEYFDQMKNEIDLEFEHVLNHLRYHLIRLLPTNSLHIDFLIVAQNNPEV